VTDPLGGVNTLWPLFGIANQMLAAIALLLGTVVLFRMGRARFAWVTIVPASWLLACTGYAAYLKLASDDPRIGFVAHARRFAAALDTGTVLAPAHSVSEMIRIAGNDRVDAAICAFLAVILGTVFACSLAAIARTRGTVAAE